MIWKGTATQICFALLARGVEVAAGSVEGFSKALLEATTFHFPMKKLLFPKEKEASL